MDFQGKKLVRIRRHPLSIYFALACATLFCGGFACVLTWMYCDLFVKNELEVRTHLLPVMIIACFFMLYYTWKRFMHSVPIVVCDGQHIFFNNQRHSISDISKISFSGQFPFKYVRSYMMEGMRIEFNDGSVRILFDDYHSNLGELKYALNEIFSTMNERVSGREIELSGGNSTVHSYESIVIARPHLLSFSGLVFYFLLALVSMCIYLSFAREDQVGLLIIAGILCFSLLAFSYQFHYFVLEESWMNARNSLWLWRNRSFKLSNIKAVVIENAANGITSARVITKDFKSHTFPADPLRKSDWMRLAIELEQRQVPVRNEAFID